MKSFAKIILLFGLLMGAASITVAQQLKTFDPSKTGTPAVPKSKQNLALEYYSSRDFEKAALLFEELYEESPTPFFYQYLLYCYLNLDEYKKAERLIKKASKDQGKPYKEIADLGYLRLKKGENTQADEMFKEAIELLPANQGAVNELASDFRNRGQNEWAEKTYIQGKKLVGNSYGFESELGYLYFFLEQYEKMTDAYLDLLQRNPEQLKTVQYRIQNAFRTASEDIIYPYLKQELLKRIKNSDNSQTFSELLLWLSIQRKDFSIAVIQAKALDKREGKEFFRVYDLALVMAKNVHYKESIEALDFILKYPDAKNQIYYTDAVQAILEARFGLLKSQQTINQQQVDELETDYELALKSLGYQKYTAKTVMNLAEIQSFYQQKPAQAMETLDSLIQMPGIPKADVAPAKLLLGNIYLLNDNPWEATLLFSQVEKDFKNDEIGFEARLRNARLSFYIGEFDWAKAQLDVLKAATGKKIANDAMTLSLFIAENLDADSSTRALELYGRADLLALQHRDSLAQETLDSIFMLSLYHEVFDDVWFKKADIYTNNHRYDEAKIYLEKIVEQYPDGLLADDAMMQLADIELNEFNNEAAASEWYKKILTDYPSSIYAAEARTAFRTLRKDFDDIKNADPL